jgi:hypothetical protein
VCVVEDKRLRREESWETRVLLLKARGCCVCDFWRRKLEIKYAIVFHCDCSILSVYMLEGE